MRLRNLEMRDARRMLEWMHDYFVVEKMQTNFLNKTIEDCQSFINNSHSEKELHLAIVDDSDTYMGTVSLKRITKDTAEFAIAVRRDAMGQGYSIWAMNEILKMGFEKYRLKYIYWCVSTNNIRALRFYDKNHFSRVEANKIVIAGGYTNEQINTYVWYQVTNYCSIDR